MPRLTHDERLQVLGMLTANMTIAGIARIFNCSRATIRNLRERHQQTGSVNDRPRPGAERVTTPEQDRYIRL